jgi:3-dehydroquinate dehydratase/shikimate dehydrogenase
VARVLDGGFPLVKVATRTRSLLDLMTLAAAAKQAPGRVVAIGLGQGGAASRVLADRVGSAWIYARWSAPGGAAPPELEDAGVPALDELVDRFRGGRVDSETPAFAVVGDRADESIGPLVFNRVFREAGAAGTYVHLKTPSLAGLREVCRLLGLRGVSVTTPFKETVLAAADRIDESVEAIGAANTLVSTGGEWFATNTDRFGVSVPVLARLAARRREPKGLAALVAGAGGMGRAAAAALREMGCRVSMTSRGADRLARASEALGVERLAPGEAGGRSWDVLINATPAGALSRDPGGRAIEASWAAPGAIVVETNYRPLETPLVRDAKKRGLDVVTGDVVYAAQAAAQLSLFAPAIGEGAGRIEAATAWALAQTASS